MIMDVPIVLQAPEMRAVVTSAILSLSILLIYDAEVIYQE